MTIPIAKDPTLEDAENRYEDCSEDLPLDEYLAHHAENKLSQAQARQPFNLPLSLHQLIKTAVACARALPRHRYTPDHNFCHLPSEQDTRFSLAGAYCVVALKADPEECYHVGDDWFLPVKRILEIIDLVDNFQLAEAETQLNTFLRGPANPANPDRPWHPDPDPRWTAMTDSPYRQYENWTDFEVWTCRLMACAKTVEEHLPMTTVQAMWKPCRPRPKREEPLPF